MYVRYAYNNGNDVLHILFHSIIDKIALYVLCNTTNKTYMREDVSHFQSFRMIIIGVGLPAMA